MPNVHLKPSVTEGEYYVSLIRNPYHHTIRDPLSTRTAMRRTNVTIGQVNFPNRSTRTTTCVKLVPKSMDRNVTTSHVEGSVTRKRTNLKFPRRLLKRRPYFVVASTHTWRPNPVISRITIPIDVTMKRDVLRLQRTSSNVTVTITFVTPFRNGTTTVFFRQIQPTTVKLTTIFPINVSVKHTRHVGDPLIRNPTPTNRIIQQFMTSRNHAVILTMERTTVVQRNVTTMVNLSPPTHIVE